MDSTGYTALFPEGRLFVQLSPASIRVILKGDIIKFPEMRECTLTIQATGSRN